ncbi:head-tail connector protein [Paraburkholderia xenovorans]|uniref:head-tail connector protein n=1 Tax=Paraburkholderia xenovorans TaxID=36873 RepID=UPI0038B91648
MVQVIAPPAQMPVSLDVAKLHLRVDGTVEDDLITIYLKAATARAENITGRALITQTLEERFSRCGGDVELTRWPVQSIESVTLAGAAVTDYTSELGDNATLFGLPRGTVVVTYKAGYGDAGDAVPEPIVQWILATVGTFYENRETEIADNRAATVSLSYLDSLLDAYRIWSA